MKMAQIITALYTFLEAGRVENNIPIVYYPNSPNAGKPQPPTGDHIVASVMPAETVSLGLASLDSYSGIIQLSVRVKPNTGQIGAATIADSILTLFARGTTISGALKIDRTGSAATGFEDGGWYNIPVTIDYVLLD